MLFRSILFYPIQVLSESSRLGEPRYCLINDLHHFRDLTKMMQSPLYGRFYFFFGSLALDFSICFFSKATRRSHIAPPLDRAAPLLIIDLRCSLPASRYPAIACREKFNSILRVVLDKWFLSKAKVFVDNVSLIRQLLYYKL